MLQLDTLPKKLGVGALILLITAGVMHFALPMVLDLKTHTDRSLAMLSEVTGQQAGVQNSRLELFPSPALALTSLAIAPNDNSDQPSLTANRARIIIGWGAVFGSEAIDTLELEDAHIKIPIDRFGTLQTGWLTHLLRGGKSPHHTIDTIRFLNGQVSILNQQDDSVSQFNHIQAILDLSADDSITSAGQFDFHGQPIAFNVDIGDIVDVELQHEQGSQLTFTGEQKTSGDGLQGKLAVNIQDISHIMGTVQTTSSSGEFSLQTQGPLTLRDGHALFARSPATLNGQPAQLGFYYGWQDDAIGAIELNSETLTVDPLFAALKPHFLPELLPNRPGAPPRIKNPLPTELDLSFILNTDKLSYGQRSYPNVAMRAELQEGEIHIHHAAMEMAGQTKLNVEGRISQGINGLRLAGYANMAGERFKDWLATHEPYAENLPEADFGNYQISGNVFLSSEQFRLSEGSLTLGALSLDGGFATYFESRPRVEAEIRLENPNFDYFRDTWRQIQQNKETGYRIFFNEGNEFDWLNRLGATIDLKLNVDGFTFLDRDDGRVANGRVYITPGQIDLIGMNLMYDNEKIQANAKLNVTKQKPHLDLTLRAGRLNLAYFDANNGQPSRPWVDFSKPVDERWSTELFDVNWMSALNGSVDIALGQLVHAGSAYNNVICKAKLNERSLVFETLSFALFGGDISITGTLKGGKVPSFSGAFGLYSADVKAILSELLNVHNISGKTNISGRLTTSGIHMLNWLKQGNMKMAASARGVRVTGLNVQGIIDVTKAARSTKDVANGIASSLFNGSTTLSVDGNLNVAGGVMKTPGIGLKYNEVLGSSIGELDLLKNRINMVAKLQFPELKSETVPTFSLSVSGNLEDYKTKTDTSSLEAYIAKRIISR